MPIKNGFLTSEFALTALLILCATLLISLDKLSIDSLVSLWPLFTSASAYSISRGLAKSKETPRPPIVVRADATQRDAEILNSDRLPADRPDRKEP